jgi:hypothetical protein
MTSPLHSCNQFKNVFKRVLELNTFSVHVQMVNTCDSDAQGGEAGAQHGILEQHGPQSGIAQAPEVPLQSLSEGTQ